MKLVKLFLILASILFILPIVSATLSLDSFSSVKYNVGDKLYLSGEVTRSNYTRGYLNFDLICDTGTNRISVVLVDVDETKSQKFSQLVVVPKNVLGNCDLQVSLIDEQSGAGLEVTKFNAFEVTNELNGLFNVNLNKLQLGDTLTVRGSVAKADGTPVNGMATIYFMKNDTALFTDNANVVNGVVEYNRDMSFVPPGTYNVDVEVNDNVGNSKYYKDLSILEMSGSIDISANFDKQSYQPGDALVLTGSVSGKNNIQLSEVEMSFIYGDEKVTRILDGNSFIITYSIASNIKSGKHEIAINSRSAGGNSGTKTVEFNVVQVPTNLTLDVKNLGFIPGEFIPFYLSLLDQASDEITSDVNLVFLDKDNKILVSGSFKANSDNTIKVPDGTKPGLFKLKVDKFGLSDESSVNVKEYTKLETTIDGNVIKVKNVGNVKYNGPLTLTAGDIKKDKNVNLDVDEIKDVELNGLIPAGIYDINVPMTGSIFKNVKIDEPTGFFAGLSSITGNVAKNVDTPGRKGLLSALMLVILGCVLYLFIKKRKGKNGYSELNSMNKKDKFVDSNKQKIVRRPVEYGKATQEDIDDFRNRMQAKFQDDEKKQSTEDFLRRQQNNIKDDKPGGMFNMFN